MIRIDCLMLSSILMHLLVVICRVDRESADFRMHASIGLIEVVLDVGDCTSTALDRHFRCWLIPLRTELSIVIMRLERLLKRVNRSRTV